MLNPSTKYSETIKGEVINEMKLKIKNEHPEYMAGLIKKYEKKTLTRLATNFGFKPATPSLIDAMASLHMEAKYKIGNDIVSVTPPACPWEAAKAYVALKDQEVNTNPGRPLPKRDGSMDSTSSTGSQKTVRFAKDEAQVRLFNNELPPNAI